MTRYIVVERPDGSIIHIEIPENGGVIHIPEGKILFLPILSNTTLIGAKHKSCVDMSSTKIQCPYCRYDGSDLNIGRTMPYITVGGLEMR